MRRPTHGTRVLLLAHAGGLAPLAVALWFLHHSGMSGVTRLTVAGLLVAGWLAFGFAVRSAVVRPLQTLANVLAALRQEDYSIDARRMSQRSASSSSMFSIGCGSLERTERAPSARSSAASRSPRASSTARSIVCSSSRTLPGQA